MLEQENCLILIIDIQEKLVSSVKGDDLVIKAAKLLKAANLLELPILISEQYPKGLGATVPTVSEVLPENTYKLEKTSFSLLRESGFLEKLRSYNKKQIILFGIEAHICVYQTVADLISEGFEVFVVKDICASRNSYEFELGFNAMQSDGAKISSLEIVLFELLKSSKHPKFKEIQALIK